MAVNPGNLSMTVFPVPGTLYVFNQHLVKNKRSPVSKIVCVLVGCAFCTDLRNLSSQTPAQTNGQMLTELQCPVMSAELPRCLGWRKSAFHQLTWSACRGERQGEAVLRGDAWAPSCTKGPQGDSRRAYSLRETTPGRANTLLSIPGDTVTTK